MRKIIRIFDVALALICIVVLAFTAAGQYTVPDEIVRYGENDSSIPSVFSVSRGEATQSVDYQSPEKSESTLRVLKIIPVKNVKITQKPASKVYVSGEAFGIKLYTDGVIVVGTQSVETETGKSVNPAQEAGIETGDIIVSINGVKVCTSDDVKEMFNDNNGLPYSIKLKRDGRYKTFTLTPAYSSREGCYKAGMWVRDSTAGIGTVTFYNKESGMFAALGHQINDVDTNELMPLLEGEAVSATVTKVEKGSAGITGSLYCNFEDYTIGRLTDNSPCGLYGAFTSVSSNAKPYEVASKQDVRKGKAYLISTVDADVPKEYEIEIIKIRYSRETEQKDMVFKVTDKTLLEKTGGIVQGMSGSPIIQNGKLIGAVTHVIVNNPEKGYAIFARTMLEKTEN